jgi:hypothetical protein
LRQHGIDSHALRDTLLIKRADRINRDFNLQGQSARDTHFVIDTGWLRPAIALIHLISPNCVAGDQKRR